MAEILEQKKLRSKVHEEYRVQFVPHLFLRCRSVTLPSFFSVVSTDPRHEALYPNLWRLIHCRPLFWCLRYLPALAAWLRLVYQRYLRKKTMDECRQMTVADILDDAQRNKWGDPAEWRASWRQFRECWNLISSKTRKHAASDEAADAIQHECKTLVIPELSDDDGAVSMVYSLPRDVGDGILILEIIQNLQNVQNDFLHSFAADADRGADRSGIGGRRSQRDLFAVQHRQTLFDLRPTHCVDIDEAGLLQIIVCRVALCFM